MSIIRHCAGPFPRPSAAAIESGGVANQFNNVGHNFANPVKLCGYRAIGAGRSGFDCADKFTDRPDNPVWARGQFEESGLCLAGVAVQPLILRCP